MKKLSLFCMIAMLSLGMVSCSDDQSLDANIDSSLQNADKLYMSIKVEYPSTSSRAGETDTENGQNAENVVKNVRLMLLEENANTSSSPILAQGYVDGKIVGNDMYYTIPINKEDILKAMGDAESKTVSLWVVCNYGSVENVNDVDYIKKYSDGNEGIDQFNANVADDGFLMSNAAHVTKKLEKANFSENPYKPYDLGTIKVERSVARFDYRVAFTGDGATYTTKFNLSDGENAKKVSVQLTAAALTNMNKSFYSFRRVSADGKAVSTEILGAETGDNYVVSTNIDHKLETENIHEDASKDFFYACNTSVNEFKFVTLPIVTNGTNDTQNGIKAGDYARLFYCTENTLPQADKGLNQKNGVSTGVVFRGRLSTEGNEDENNTEYGVDINSTEETVKANPNIYVFNGVLLGTWAKVAEKAASDASLKAAYLHVGEEENAAKATEANFTVYSREKIGGESGYFMYYYYWNQHRKNSSSTEMGPMEYAVVRNNVYKLYVTKISAFGHPSNTENDPYPVNPNDPNEKSDYYFQVNVEVQPWVVRQNDIEF